MIFGIVGEMGSGKTLLMTLLLYADYRSGRKIIANYNLKFPHDIIDLKGMIAQIKERKQLINVTLGIDEIGVLIDSRRAASKKNMIFSYLALQSRKREMDIVFCSQWLYQVDKRIRDNTDFLFKSKKLAEGVFLYSLQKKTDSNVLEAGDYYEIKKFTINTKDLPELYALYDTREMILDMGEI